MLQSHYYTGLTEAGVDEAGRGCLAGPVFAAAVVLPDDYQHPLLNDSKQLTDHQRRQLRPIIEHNALAWAVGTCSPEEIDKLNILNASILAMHRALDRIDTDQNGHHSDTNIDKKSPATDLSGFSNTEDFHRLTRVGISTRESRVLEAVIVDGNRFKPWRGLPFTTIVKGDGKMMAIAAASILAKTYRDDYMIALSKEFPHYGWEQNKGYPTKAHRDAIRQHGLTPHHRLSFTQLPPQQLTLPF